MKPVVDGLAKKYAGRVDVRVMNASSNDAEVARLAQLYGVQYVPTFVFVNADGTHATTIVGGVSTARLEAELGKLR